MANKKKIHIGTVKADPRDLSRDRGHEYGAGRSAQVQRDRRNRKKNTRRDRVKESLKGW